MWLKVAKYDAAYVRYHDRISLLEMHEFGPYGVGDADKVEEFAETILAFMLQDGELRQEKEVQVAAEPVMSIDNSPLSSPADSAADMEGSA